MDERRIVVCGPQAHHVADRMTASISDIHVRLPQAAEGDNIPRSELCLQTLPTGACLCVRILSTSFIKPYWYRTISAVVLAFDHADSQSLVELATHWFPLLEQNIPGAPIFLAGWDGAGLAQVPPHLPPILRELPLFTIAPVSSRKPQRHPGAAFLLAACLVSAQETSDQERLFTGPRPSTNWHIYTHHSTLAIAILARILECSQESPGSRELDLSALDDTKRHPDAAQNINFLLHSWALSGVANMSGLVHVNLSHNYLREVPAVICTLQDLVVLDLSNNLLEYLPSRLATLPKLKRLRVRGNPLTYVPAAAQRTTSSLLQHLGYLYHPSVSWDQLKLLAVGEAGAGKSHLLHSLQKRSTQRYAISQLGGFSPSSLRRKRRDIRRRTGSYGGWNSSLTKSASTNNLVSTTDGVEVSLWTVSESLTYTCWDFAGHSIFSSTHPLFLSGRSVYLLTFRLDQPAEEKLEYWLQQIDSVSPYQSYVVLVGTHADLVIPEVRQRIRADLLSQLQNRFPCVCDYFEVSLDNPVAVDALAYYLSSTLPQQHRILERRVPGAWREVDLAVKRLRESGAQTMTRKDFRELARRHGVQMEHIEIVSEFLHDVGTLLSFQERTGLTMVVLDPTWISRVLSCIVNNQALWIHEGILLQRDWEHVWTSYSLSMRPFLFSLLENFEVAHRLRGNPPRCLIPALLPEERPNQLIEEYWSAPSAHDQFRYGRVWRFSFLPAGIFPRVLVRMLHFPQAAVVKMWRTGSLWTYGNQQKALLEFGPGSCFQLEVRTTKPGLPKLLQIILECVDSLLNSMFSLRADQKSTLVPCIHCWRHSPGREPYFFHLEDIILAISRGSPFVYCNNIATRQVRVDLLAPDVAFAGIPTLPPDCFSLEEKIGEGGFGEVFRGSLHGSPPVPVAIKRSLVDDTTEVVDTFSAFQREVQVMSCLEHPNLVRLIGVTAVPNQPLLMVMEYIEGGTLHDLLHSPQELDWDLRLRIALDVATGMRHLHRTTPPFVHRDLRSPNILMVSTDPEDKVLAKVGDFGMACRSAPDSGGSLITWQWHAPEVLSASTRLYDERIDIYSFGMVLYEIATRLYPFEEFVHDMRFGRIMEDDSGSSHLIIKEIEIRQAIEHDNLRPTLPHGLPAGLKELIVRCWDACPDKRPSFEFIVNVLSQLLGVTEERDDETIDLHTYCHPNRFTHASTHLSDLSVFKDGDPRKAPSVPTSNVFRYSSSASLPLNSNPLCMIVACGNIWCGTDTGDLLIWNIKERSMIRSHRPHQTCIYSLLVVHDQVWSTSECYRLFVWDIDTQTEQECLTTHEKSVRHLMLEYTPDRPQNTRYVWSCSPQGMIQQWDANEFYCVAYIDLQLVYNRVCFVAQISRQRIWVAADKWVIVLTPTLEEVGRFRAHERKVTQILPTPQGVWTCSDDGTIAIWERASLGKLLKRTQVHWSEVSCLLGLGNYVLSGGEDSSIIVWDCKTKTPVQELSGYHNGTVKCLLAAEGWLWSASYDHTLAVWELDH